MERRLRRFVPGPEGLEGRMVLSAVAAPPAALISTATTGHAAQQAITPSVVVDDAVGEQATATATAAQSQARAAFLNRPLTPAQEQAKQQMIATRMQRIDRLPAFLRSLDPGRELPVEAIATIQQELRGLVAQLRPPAQPVAEGFVDVLRDAIGDASISQATVAQLNNATTRLLQSAGAPETTIDRIVDGLTDLARSASQSAKPVVVMTNDYALVLQTTLGIGRPITRVDLLQQATSGSNSSQFLGNQSTLAGGQGIGGQGF